MAVLSIPDGLLVGYATKSFKSSLRGRSYGAAHLLHTWLGRHNIKLCGVEKPNRFYNAIFSGAGIIYIIDYFLGQAGIPSPEILTATQLKKFATGKGNAKKPDMIAAVKKLYPDFDGDDNAADAIMIALYTLEQYKASNGIA